MLRRISAFVIASSSLFIPFAANAQWLPAGATSGPIHYSGGNVGIGTSAPAWSLHVAGNIGVKGSPALIRTATDFDSDGLTFLGTKLVLGQINSRAYGYTGSAIAFIGGWNDNIDLLRMASQNGTGLLTVTQSSVSTLKFTLTNNGAPAFTISGSDTGIGTATPASRLDVAGKLRAIGANLAAKTSGNSTSYHGGGRQSGGQIYGPEEGDGSAYTFNVPNTTDSGGFWGGKAGAYIRGGNAFNYAGGGAGVVAIGGDAKLSISDSTAEGGAGIYARGGLNAPSGATRAYAGYFDGDVVATGIVATGILRPTGIDTVAPQGWGVGLRVTDPAAMAQGFGPGIELIGKYTTAGALTQFGWIRAAKLTPTTGDPAGKLMLSVRKTDGNWAEVANLQPGSLTFNGNTHFNGTVTGTAIHATYQDVAEWVPSTEKLPAGTVVVLDAVRSNHVLPSSRPYDTTVAGVVSQRPGLILGEAGESKAMIATTGRVRVRVDATKHPIAIGDLLVTSDKPGAAMKSIPLDLQGIAIHRPGTLSHTRTQIDLSSRPLEHK